MKWKDVILGALISLFVAVAGGLALYHLTKDPELSKKEKLVYTLSEGGVFKGGVSELALSSIGLKNIGGMPASNVVILVKFESATINDISLDSDAGAKESGRELKEKYLELRFDKLLPSEGFSINLLLSSPENPEVSIRSDDSIASRAIVISNKRSSINEFLGIGIPFSGVLLFVTLVVLLRIVRASGSELGSSKNNTGFLLMHAGLVDQAYDIFSSAVESGRYDALTLSNLALCCALRGEDELSEKYNSAATYRDLMWHGKAVALFNEALMLLTKQRTDEGLDKLEEAIKSSSKSIKKYCKYSVHFSSVQDNERFKQLSGIA